jgi:PAS domain S-box-containing protein
VDELLISGANAARQPEAQTSERRQREQQWQALLDSAGEGIWGLDLAGNCTFVNRMATRIFGFSSHDMVGKNMHTLVHHHYADGREYPASECPIYELYSHNQPLRQLKDTMFRKDGSAFLAEMSAEPVVVDGQVIGVVVTFRDISEIHLQQQELRRAYALAERRTAELDAVIESMPHGVFIATQDGKVRSNLRGREMSGEDFPTELQTLQRSLEGTAFTQTVHVQDQWIRSVAAPIFLNDAIIGGVAVNTDVTQARRQEEALRKSEKLAAVGQLASSIAHEINNPLESITNLLYLIRQATSMDEVQAYAMTAQSELSRVTEITLQTLRFHRQQSKPADVDLAGLLRNILSLYTGRFLVRGITLDFDAASAPSILCNEGEIRQVFNNLIRNAVDAMPAGGRLVVRARSACNAQQQPGVRVTIADSGEGISPNIAERLFEPFQTTKELTGTGLGLWVSKGIVDKHGGRIAVRTRRAAPSGTAFSLWFSRSCEGLHAPNEAQGYDSHNAQGQLH